MGIVPRQRRGVNAAIYCLVAAFAAGLKYATSNIGAAALGWILAPTAYLVGQFSGVPFSGEAGTGYVNLGEGIVIAPACGGVNFFVMTVCMTAVAGIPRIGSIGGKLFWFLISIVGAYFATLGVNTLRIVGSIHLYRADIYGPWLTVGRLHRLEGVILYLTALWGTYVLVNGFFNGVSRSSFSPDAAKAAAGRRVMAASVAEILVPLTWYLIFVLLVPTLNLGARGSTLFPEHCVTVAAGCAVVLLAVLLIQWGCRRSSPFFIRDPGTRQDVFHEGKNSHR